MRHQNHPHSLKQLSQQDHQTDLTTQQTIISKERENIKENIRNFAGNWYEQDVIMVNVFLYLNPMEVFLPEEGCLMVCKNWNQLISGQEFAKYYFEHSFCVSTPFVNDQNLYEFDSIDSRINYNLNKVIEESVDAYEDDLEEYEEEYADEELLEFPCYVKYFENELGYETKLVWKNNFYRKFLILVSLMEKDSFDRDLASYLSTMDPSSTLDSEEEKHIPLSETIGKLEKQLSQSQLEKLNTILKKLKFSKLLTSSIQTASGNVVIFNDYGVPYILSSRGNFVFVGCTMALNVKETSYKKRLSLFLPACTSASEEQTFGDILCRFLPPVVKVLQQAVMKKRPLSAYMLFSQEERKRVQEEEPHLKITEIAKKVGANWLALSESEKQPFLEKATKTREQIEREKANIVLAISGLD